ncbi:hypothetical protein FQN54_007381 [Arachnomyces sp. PD_36]|nr:hypothetical protein FQN54_007381 [Arachnomyces sp. PD_36]
MQLTRIALSLAAVFVSVQATPVDVENAEPNLDKRSCSVTLCRGEGQVDCDPPVEANGCVNVQGVGNYISAVASPGCYCDVYEQNDCSWWAEERWETVDDAGFDLLPFIARGADCS